MMEIVIYWKPLCLCKIFYHVWYLQGLFAFNPQKPNEILLHYTLPYTAFIIKGCVLIINNIHFVGFLLFNTDAM